MSLFKHKKTFKLKAAVEEALDRNCEGLFNLYRLPVVEEIRHILQHTKHTCCSMVWNNCEGETICFSWIENGEIFSEMFDVVFVIEEDKEND
jgi:hypothetical protein